ncbi:MAG: tetratricopeptide repeat protein [Bacteroidetes bacterium]|nr:tetratricopeptide repeat protein [Bacteroidota bacterium]
MANKEETAEFDIQEIGIQDEIPLKGNFISNNVQKNLKQILIIIGIVVIAIIGMVIYNKSNESKELEASVALSRVMTYYENGDYDKALSGDKNKLVRGNAVIGLKEIVDQYGSTENGEVAAIYAGNALVAKKDYVTAADYFRKGLGSESVDVVISSNAGLAICEESKNENSASAEHFEKAANLSKQPSLQAKYYLYAAMNFEKIGNKEKAEKLYREIIKLNIAEYETEAKCGLTRLGMIIE